MVDDVVINDENFGEYFFDVRQNNPQKGQVMACFTAKADFVDGLEKRQVIDLLKNTGKAEATAQVMRKLLHASEIDAYKVPRMIAEDLMTMEHEEVAQKPYRYTMELFFYTKKEYIPRDDPHWSVVSLMNVDEFVTKITDGQNEIEV